MTTESLLIAASLFVITKVIFSFVGWFLSVEGDSFVRQRLSAVWETLEDHTLPELLHWTLIKLVSRIRETFGSSRRALSGLLAAIFVINLLSVVLAWYYYNSLDEELLHLIAIIDGHVWDMTEGPGARPTGVMIQLHWGWDRETLFLLIGVPLFELPLISLRPP